MTVLITGANGRTSRYVINSLLSTAECPPLRLLVHTEASRNSLESAFPQLLSSPHSIIIADYLNIESMKAALANISIVFYNGPAFHPLETAMGISAITAAQESGENPHFIFCSVFHPYRTKLLNHKAKCNIEEYLVESTLPYTILQPTSYMQNIHLHHVRETGTLPSGYSPHTVQGFLNLEDLAQVALNVILHPQPHELASYELVGQNMSHGEIAQIISMQLGKPVACHVLSREVATQRLLENRSKDSHYSKDAAQRMLLYYDHWGLAGNSGTLRFLLGREPTSLDQFIRSELKN